MLTAELAFVTDLRRAASAAGSFGGTALGGGCTSCAHQGMTFEEIMADPVGHLGEEARALIRHGP